MNWFEWSLIASIILFILAYSANALIVAFTEAKNKSLPNKYRYPAVIITTAILLGLMALWSRSCQSSNEELTAPNGQTTIEHYEPRITYIPTLGKWLIIMAIDKRPRLQSKIETSSE